MPTMVPENLHVVGRLMGKGTTDYRRQLLKKGCASGLAVQNECTTGGHWAEHPTQHPPTLEGVERAERHCPAWGGRGQVAGEVVGGQAVERRT